MHRASCAYDYCAKRGCSDHTSLYEGCSNKAKSAKMLTNTGPCTTPYTYYTYTPVCTYTYYTENYYVDGEFDSSSQYLYGVSCS